MAHCGISFYCSHPGLFTGVCSRCFWFSTGIDARIRGRGGRDVLFSLPARVVRTGADEAFLKVLRIWLVDPMYTFLAFRCTQEADWSDSSSVG